MRQLHVNNLHRRIVRLNPVERAVFEHRTSAQRLTRSCYANKAGCFSFILAITKNYTPSLAVFSVLQPSESKLLLQNKPDPLSNVCASDSCPVNSSAEQKSSYVCLLPLEIISINSRFVSASEQSDDILSKCFFEKHLFLNSTKTNSHELAIISMNSV